MDPIVTLLIVLLAVVAVFYIANSIGLPDPIPMIIKGFVGILAILYIVQNFIPM